MHNLFPMILAAMVVLATGSAQADVLNMPTGQTSLQTVVVGNPGNAADPATGSLYGSVGYTYQIGTYDVTTAQYCQFLNAVAKTDTYGLYSTYMATDYPTVAVTRSGSSGSYSYSVTGSYSQGANCPIFDVSWGDAARFCNWLQNGQPTGAEGVGTTETGAYTLNGATTLPALMAITRNGGASDFLPSENEWYKAAYYDPTLNGGSGGYWLYPTKSNTAPSNVLSATGTNNANCFDSQHYQIPNPAGYTDPTNKMTPVGYFAGSPGPYGTFDQGGDVWQWNETAIGQYARGWRGGSWGYNSSYVASSSRLSCGPAFEDYYAGFRVAYIPRLYFSGVNNIWDQDATAKWSGQSGGPYDQIWSSSSNAMFEGAAGTVTVADAISSVNSITFTTDGYTLGGAGTITLTGTGGYIITGPGTDAISATIAGNVGLTKQGAGTLILSGANSYYGGTTINGGTLNINADSALGTAPASPTMNVTFAGNSTLQAGAATVSLSANRNVVVNGGITATIDTQGNAMTIPGIISGSGSLTKLGAGALTLSGANTYTGPTTVKAGTLELGPSAQSPVLAGGGANILAGSVVFDYAGSSPASTIQSLLTTSYHAGAWNIGQFTTNTTGGVTLGWKDDGVSKVTVMATLAGDTNLDGSVNLADLNTLISNYGTGTTWAQGDFNYDGQVNLSDLNALLGSYGKTAPVSSAVIVAGMGLGTVPEPSTLILLASGLVSVLTYARRRRRKLQNLSPMILAAMVVLAAGSAQADVFGSS